KHAVEHEDAAAQNLADRHADRLPAAGRQPCEDRFGLRVVDTDHRGRGGPYQPRLYARVVLQRAVAVDMVGRDVGEHADVRLETGREIDLIGRYLQHINGL